MSDIVIVQESQAIHIDPSTNTISVTLTGPAGPSGPAAASQISVADATNKFTAVGLEDILEEIGQRLEALEP